MKTKSSIVAFAVAISFAGSLLGAPRNDRPPAPSYKIAGPQTSVTDATLGANRIFSYVTNLGTFARDNVGVLNLSGGGGMVFPFAGLENIENGKANKTCVFASGIWIGAEDVFTGDTLMIISEFSEECVPGPMLNGTFQPDDPAFRVYTLYSDSLASNPNQDYLDWPVSQGAPVDSAGNPQITGDQMLWCVFNDADFASHGNDAGGTLPMGLEIQFSVFAFSREDPLGNIMFLRYKIMNKGSKNLRNLFISLWSDPDLGGFTDDLVGSDSSLSLGFVFNANNNDGVYGSNPPAVGYDFFQGPLDSTGNPADTAIMWGQFLPGNVNLPLASFNKYINGTDPDLPSESYAYQNGLDGKTGLPLIDPTTGQPTKFFGNGDPVTNTGFIDSDPADRRFMLNTGPIVFSPGDSTEIIAAIIVGQGVDRLTSISAMKFFDQFAQTAYEKFFNLPKAPVAPVVNLREFENEIVLYWDTDSEDDPGDFVFEGYTIYQGESPTGPWKRLTTFDLNNGLASIFDDQFDLNQGVVLNVPVQFGVDGGIQRQISITDDAIGGGRLNNVTDYFFRVEAYSFDPTETPKVLTASTVVTATPQEPVAETDFPLSYGEVPLVTHIGQSDGVVSPLVVDPTALTGNSYMVIFTDSLEAQPPVIDTTAIPPDTTFDTLNITRWSLFDTTTGDTLQLRELNQSGDDTGYVIIDGLLMRVGGPFPPGMKDWDIPSGTRRFTWASADGLDFEGFNGAIGWHNPLDFFINQLTFPAVVGPSELVNVELRLAEVTIIPMIVDTIIDTLMVPPDTTFDTTQQLSYTFDPNDPNVSYAYRYGRSFGAPAARPEFAPFLINTTAAGYGYQDYNQSVPLSAWNMDANPPQRLALGFLENNQINGRVDGNWFPGDFNKFDNVDGAGPREWLFIYTTDYSTTPEPAFQTDVLLDTIPVMYWLTVNRRGEVPFSPPLIDTTVTPPDTTSQTGIDRFLILASKINTPGDTFTFTSPAPVVASSVSEAALTDVRAVPNPYYLFSTYEPDQFLRELRFTNLPTKCTIRIFNLNGEIVRTLEKDNSDSFFPWDVQTVNRLPVGSGIYIYLVTTPDGSEKIGKMAIFTEAEQLSNF